MWYVSKCFQSHSFSSFLKHWWYRYPKKSPDPFGDVPEEVQVHVSALNAAITACEKSRLWQRALAVFEQIEEMKLQPKHGKKRWAQMAVWKLAVSSSVSSDCHDFADLRPTVPRVMSWYLFHPFSHKGKTFHGDTPFQGRLVLPMLKSPGMWSVTAPWSQPTRRRRSGKGRCSLVETSPATKTSGFDKMVGWIFHFQVWPTELGLKCWHTKTLFYKGGHT